MKKFVFPILIISIFLLINSCKDNDNNVANDNTKSGSYYILNILGIISSGKTLLSVNSFQQTTEYTCGPASVMTLLRYYAITGSEMNIAEEMGTSSSTGTTPEQMTTWLNKNGFTAEWHEEGTLEILRENLSNGIPTLVEWSDWGGHWVLVIGYDTRQTDDLMDDVIIFADPYDHHDDNKDGFTFFNAQRFYYMWYDALLFGRVMKRVYINAIHI